ncbi:MAG TPA: hypothetical protein PLB07_11305 [Bacteroidales bacterium]|nr:hypothetical protein [Bacteroidales bacterium]
MKKIAKMTLIVAAVLLAATGCQKIEDDIDVTLKSSGVMTIVNNWKSGSAVFECKAAGGECGYAFKIDEWDEESGMDGAFETMEGNTITILNSNGKTFDFVSEYPVCKVIVKAGRGAIVYSYPEGTYEDQGLIGFQSKGISHVTFCYAEPPELIIAFKVQYNDGIRNKYGESVGTMAFVSTEWCGVLGYNPYPTTSSIEIARPGFGVIGTAVIDNKDVTITLNEGNTLVMAYLFIGTLEDLQTTNLLANGCPWFYNPNVWILNSNPLVNSDGLSYMFFDL